MAEDPSRILTIPNLLSVGRLVGVGVFVYLLVGAHSKIPAAALLAVMGITDFLDGYIARHFNQVSDLGKVLDPTADRIVLLASVIAIVVYGAVPVWLAIVVLVREALVSAAVLILAALGGKRIDVIWAGKAGTFGLLCCFPLFLLSYGPATWEHVLRTITWVCVFPALALGWYAAIAYVPLAVRSYREGHSASPSLPASDSLGSKT